MDTYKDIPVISFDSVATYQSWLEKNYELKSGIWIKIAKKDSGIASVTRAQALEVALCWGWIDGQAKSLDDTWYLQKFTPRRARSIWSKINVAKVTKLIEEGRMQPPGFAEIEAAKADGRWEAAYDPPKSSVIPPELAAALDADEKAKAFFQTLSKPNRYACTWRVATAKTPAGKARRVETIMTMLRESKTFH